MIQNRFFRSGVFGLVIAGMMPGFTGNAYAFSGGVTTYGTQSPGTLNEIITRTRTAAATTAEYNQTYQRTMKVAATAVAVRTSAISIARGSIGAILAVAAVAQLAIDLKGIWGPDPTTGKSTVITLEKVPCDAIGSGCVTYSIQYSRLPFVYSSRQACLDEIGRIAKTASASSYTYITSDKYGCDVTEVKGTYKGVVTWAMDTSVGAVDQSSNPKYATDEELDSRLQQPDRIVPFVKALDDAGTPVVFSDPEKEVLPQAIPLPPIVVTFPDGTTKTERASLVPYFAPDDTVHWKRPSEITTTYPPGPDGIRPPATVSKSDNAPPIAGTDPQVNSPTTPEPKPETPATDTPLPEQPKLYKQKYPEGIVGVYKTARDAMGTSPLFTMAKDLMPSVMGGGTCPRMPINLTFSSWANFGTKDVAPPCQVWDWGRAIIVVSALLLARRLVFGG